MVSSKNILLLIPLSCFISFLSCDNSVVPAEFNDATLVYVRTGGFAASYNKLTIDNFGLATYQSATFSSIFQLQLNDEEYKEIKSFYSGFDNYKDSYPGNCMDDFHYKLSLKNIDREKSFEFDGCAMDKYPELNQMAELVSVLENLMIRIYNEKATWIGLSYEFRTNKTEYSSGEDIIFSCKIINPTEMGKSIYFPNKYKIQFALNNYPNQPLIQIWVPERSVVNTDTTAPSKIHFAPGEEKIIEYSWNQSFVNFDKTSYNRLPIGKYSTWVFLLGGVYPAKDGIEFEIK